MSNQLTGKPQICVDCKTVALTSQEEASKNKRCAWCELVYIDQLTRALGEEHSDSVPDFNPKDFGRTQAEIDQGPPQPLRKSQAGLPPAQIAIPLGSTNAHGIGKPADGPDFSPEAKKLLKDGGYDMDNPTPYTLIESRGNTGTKLSFAIPAGIDPEHAATIQTIMDKTLSLLMRILVYGVLHDDTMDNLRQNLNPSQPGPDGFPQ
jgi:hypothetical protein